MKKVLLNSRNAIALTHDIAAAFLAWFGAFLLRFNFEFPPEHFALMKETLIIVIPFQTISFLTFGLYRGAWRFVSMPDLKRILLIVAASNIALVALLFMLNTSIRVPRSVLIINPILLILIMGGGRFLYRSIKEYQLYGPYLKKGEPVIIFGANATAISLVKDLSQGDVNAQ